MPTYTRKNRQRSRHTPNVWAGNAWGNIPEPENPVFDNWTMPDISNVKDISEKFPVFLSPFHKSNGEKGYKITWHLANLKEWRNTQPETWDEYQDYEAYVISRLRYTLAMHSDYYRDIPTEHPDELFRIITLALSPKQAPKAVTLKQNAKQNAINKVPKFFLLNDIKNHFPVVWHKDPHDPKLLGIQFHKVKLQELAKIANKPLKEFEATMVASLLQALKASEVTGAWEVMAPTNKYYVCMLHLKK